ncbi:MAG: tripartite tricarboxylate transporter TctB family protein [Oscillospiraceae bacterium]
MEKRKASLLFSAFFILLGSIYLYQAAQLPVKKTDFANPSSFPNIIGIGLIVLSLYNAARDIYYLYIKTEKAKSDVIRIPYLKKMSIVTAMLVVFIAAWWITGQFYICGAIFLMVALLYFTERGKWKKNIPLYLVLSLSFMALVYAVFYRAMQIDF